MQGLSFTPGLTVPTTQYTGTTEDVADSFVADSFLDELASWETAVPGEDRSVVAARLREVHEKNLTSLCLRDYPTLTTLPALLPSSLTELTINDCPALTHLPTQWPDKLISLYIALCPALSALPNQLPANLNVLKLSSCGALTALPAQLPSILKSLDITYCTSLQTLPAVLPEQLTALLLRHCSRLSALPQQLPAHLKKLDVAYCSSLAFLPDPLPKTLRELYLVGCQGLIMLPVVLPAELSIIGVIPSHLRLSTPPHEVWFQKAGKTSAELSELRAAWSNIIYTPFYRSFHSLLIRLGEAKLADSVEPLEVAQVIEEVLYCAATRQAIFEAALSADQDCHDRPLSLFNTIQSIACFSKLQREGAHVNTLLAHAEAMLKLSLLDEATTIVMSKQWQEKRRPANETEDGPDASEALEVQLALRHELGHALNLPFKVKQPIYALPTAGLDEGDKQLALEYVNATLNDLARKAQGLVALPMWSAYLHSVLAAPVASVRETYQHTLNAMEEDSTALTTHEYMEKTQQLMVAQEAEIHALFVQKTLELLHSRVETEMPALSVNP